MFKSCGLSLIMVLTVAGITGTALAEPDYWDSRLDEICGLYLEDVSDTVSSGNYYWRLVSGVFEDEIEAEGMHHMLYKCLDASGDPIEGQKIWQSWWYTNETGFTSDFTKGALDSYWGNIAMYGNCPSDNCDWPYNGWVDTASGPSDKVWGMGLHNPNGTPCNAHVNFRLTWKWTQKSGGGPTPTISLNPSSLSPSTDEGSSPAADSFTVQNSGTGTLYYSISDDASWLSVSPTSGSSTGEADTITVNYSTASLSAGTYNATITVSDPNATNNPQTVAVELTVNSVGGSGIQENFNSMPSWNSEFDAGWGGSANWSITSSGQSGSALQIDRTNGGSSSKVKLYDITASTDYTISVYIACPSASNYWAECAFKLGSNSAQNFDSDAGSWTMIQKFDAWGTNGNGNSWAQYSKTFNSGSDTQISVGFKLGSSDGNAPAVRYDTLLIDDGGSPPPQDPTISLSTSSLSPTTDEGSSPANDSFTVSNSGDGTLEYSITDDASWLSVSPTSGTSTGEADTITVSYSTASLEAGTYNATITVSDPDATNNPQTIAVTLTVNSVGGPTVAEDFDSMPSWDSAFDAGWGGSANWSITSSGQSGNGLQIDRSNGGSSAKVKLYNVDASTNYTISIWIRCPSASNYWAECAMKRGNNSAQNFDSDPSSWTMIKKFDAWDVNGNGDTWTKYSTTFDSFTETQISVGFKLGSSDGNAPVVRYDTLRVEE